MFGIEYPVLEPRKASVLKWSFSVIGLLFLLLLINCASFKYAAELILAYLFVCFTGVTLYYEEIKNGEAEYIRDPVLDYGIILFQLYLLPCMVFFFWIFYFAPDQVAVDIYRNIEYWPAMSLPIWVGDALQRSVSEDEKLGLAVLFLKSLTLAFVPFALAFSVFFSEGFKNVMLKHKNTLLWIFMFVCSLSVGFGVSVGTEKTLGSYVGYIARGRWFTKAFDAFAVMWGLYLPGLVMVAAPAIIGALRAWHYQLCTYIQSR